MNIVVSFSGRADGNCDKIASYIAKDKDIVLHMRDISTQPCANCAYECMGGSCKYGEDGVYAFFEQAALAERIYFVVPMYCGNPAALYFIMNERCQYYFVKNEAAYERMIKKLFVIGVYGNHTDSPDFLKVFERQYAFENERKHILGLERHVYHHKMKDFLLEEEEVRNQIDEWLSEHAK